MLVLNLTVLNPICLPFLKEKIANMFKDPHTTDKVKLNKMHLGQDIYKHRMYYDALVIYKSSRSFKFPEKVQ